MPKFPWPPAPDELRDVRATHHTLRAGTPMARLYAARDLLTCAAEVFQGFRVVDRFADDRCLAAFRLERSMRLLDLTGDWPTRAGASQAISSGPRPRAQAWARAIYDACGAEAVATVGRLVDRVPIKVEPLGGHRRIGGGSPGPPPDAEAPRRPGDRHRERARRRPPGDHGSPMAGAEQARPAGHDHQGLSCLAHQSSSSSSPSSSKRQPQLRSWRRHAGHSAMSQPGW